MVQKNTQGNFDSSSSSYTGPEFLHLFDKTINAGKDFFFSSILKIMFIDFSLTSTNL